jgi:8-oxo-dGTP pyrophosphatase MutT (NUDIX family)|tara:strand:+ start:1664 stop:2413 length:750 start_codon:yes stop_codon:yes gene_type:complete
VVDIRKAATVLLVRPSEKGPELFMLQRPGRGVFPDLHVFPGGKVDQEDADLEASCFGLNDQLAASKLGLKDNAIRYWVTVIRECFEESGVLLARRQGKDFYFRDDTERSHYQGLRERLLAGELDFAAIIGSEGLELATDRVHYFSHWITPETAPARFDTRFFLAAMPRGQQAVGDDRETVSGEWILPTEALQRHERGDWQMIYPTLTTLNSVADFSSVKALVDSVQEGLHFDRVTPELHRQGMQLLQNE